MTHYDVRPYHGAEDLPLVIEFARTQLAARAPRLSYLHPGDVTWQLYLANEAAGDFIRLWFDGAGLAAFAIFEPPLHSNFDFRVDLEADSSLVEEILGWIESRRRESYAPGETIPIAYSSLGTETVATVSLESDAGRIAVLERLGWQRTPHHAVRYRRSIVAPIEAPLLPDGYFVRHATAAHIDARAELHRLAWNVWGPSQFSANRYRRLRASPGYREDLDIVVEAPDGKLVSYCICWADDSSGIGTFEPVGTREDYIGRGLGSAAVHEGLRRLREAGMHTALIATSSVNTRALGLYPRCGFEFVERQDSWVKPIR